MGVALNWIFLQCEVAWAIWNIAFSMQYATLRLVCIVGSYHSAQMIFKNKKKLPSIIYQISVIIFVIFLGCNSRLQIVSVFFIALLFLHPEWNSDVKESLFLVFRKTKFCYLLQDLLIVGVLCQLIFNRFIEFSHIGVSHAKLLLASYVDRSLILFIKFSHLGVNNYWLI